MPRERARAGSPIVRSTTYSRPCALPPILHGTWLRFAMSDMSYMSDVENLSMSDISYIAN